MSLLYLISLIVTWISGGQFSKVKKISTWQGWECVLTHFICIFLLRLKSKKFRASTVTDPVILGPWTFSEFPFTPDMRKIERFITLQQCNSFPQNIAFSLSGSCFFFEDTSRNAWGHLYAMVTCVSASLKHLLPSLCHNFSVESWTRWLAPML